MALIPNLFATSRCQIGDSYYPKKNDGVLSTQIHIETKTWSKNIVHDMNLVSNIVQLLLKDASYYILRLLSRIMFRFTRV